MADSQIHTDPERLRRFAQGLKQFAASSDEQLSRMRSAIGHLGQTWQDQEFDRFVQQFAKEQSRLKSFSEEIMKVAPVLEDDASKIEEYLRFRKSA